MLKDHVTIKTKVLIDHYDKNGRLLTSINTHNLVVNTGRVLIASRLVDASLDPVGYIGIGSSAAQPVASNSTLGLQSARVALSEPPTLDGNVVLYKATFGAGVGTGQVSEAGLFNEPTLGIMFSRTTFSVITKDVDDIIIINWSLTFN